MRLPLPTFLAWGGIAVMVAAILLGPLASPPEFSWLRHSTSEQAAQHLQGAWIMRTGFAAFGIGTVGAAFLQTGGRGMVRAALVVFGLGMVAAAIWSNAPILPDVPADMREDWAHSVASGVVGAAFATACVARLFVPGGNRRDALAWLGLAASVILPLVMVEVPAIHGVAQRVMFGISFVFIAREFAPRAR
jgi:hypothetical protein